MSITPTALFRTAGVAAVASGVLFIAVQINHPVLTAGFATTTEYVLRESAKIVMAFCGLVGITGMYLRQVRQTGVVGLLGYLLFATGFLTILSVQVIGVAVIPRVAAISPDYVDDVLAALGGGSASGDIGALSVVNSIGGLAYLLGGLVFGFALFRANVLARWASVILAAGTVATFVLPFLPDFNDRLLAIPTGIAMIGLGYSLVTRAHDPAAAVGASATTTAPATR